MSRNISSKAEQISCDAPLVGEMVYDYFNGVLEAASVRQFERHLVACRHCETVIHELDQVLMLVPEDQDRSPAHSGLTGFGGQSALLEKLCF